jgi:hypothetical protein
VIGSRWSGFHRDHPRPGQVLTPQERCSDASPVQLALGTQAVTTATLYLCGWPHLMLYHYQPVRPNRV